MFTCSTEPLKYNGAIRVLSVWSLNDLWGLPVLKHAGHVN